MQVMAWVCTSVDSRGPALGCTASLYVQAGGRATSVAQRTISSPARTLQTQAEAGVGTATVAQRQRLCSRSLGLLCIKYLTTCQVAMAVGTACSRRPGNAMLAARESVKRKDVCGPVTEKH
jgi:hypothetical protein